MAIRIGSGATAPRSFEALPGWGKKLRDWVLKTVGGILVGLITAVWTPIGDAAIEWVHPTEARVEGTVVQNGRPARGRIHLDGERADESNSVGVYVFDDVPKGSHDLLISQDGALVYDLDIHVAAKQETLTVPTIDLAAAVPMPKAGSATGATNPHYVSPVAGTPEADSEASPAPAPTAGATEEEGAAEDSSDAEATFETEPLPAASPAAGWDWDFAEDSPVVADRDAIHLAVDQLAGTEDLRTTVWVEADSPVLNEIDRVTYYLDPAFDPSVVTRYDPWDGFALTFPVAGSFDLIARVYFWDGTSVDLVVSIDG